VIPPEANAEFVCCMENVLDIYKRPYDPKHPVVCFDETNKQLVKENKTPLVAELDSGKFSSRVSEKRKSDMRYPRVPLCPKLADIENR
jgi:hypothetical protein